MAIYHLEAKVVSRGTGRSAWADEVNLCLEQKGPDELMDARLTLRPEEESRAASTRKENDNRQYDTDIIKQAKANVAKLLGEEPASIKPISLRENLRQKQKAAQQRELPQRKKSRDLER